jgi:hypothetical protein
MTKKTLLCHIFFCGSTVVLLGVPTVRAQAVPAATAPAPYQGFGVPDLRGNLSYAVSASETVTTGYNGGDGTATSTNISGDVAYLSRSETHPFSAVYSGGFLGSTSGYQPSTTFQNLSLSQVFKQKKWNFIVGDTVSYLPQSPTVGLSGIPGLGDLAIDPVQVGQGFGSGILTNYANRVSNFASATATRNLTGSTSIEGTGSYGIQRFLTDSVFALNSNQVTGSGGLNHRINARNTVAANYSYSRFTYVDEPYTFNTNGLSFEYVRSFTPRLIMDASIGPQWNAGTTFSSTSLSVAGSLFFSYVREKTSMSLGYTRGTNNGSGVVPGALSDSIGFSARRMLNRAWGAAGSVSYAHSSSLSNVTTTPFSIDAIVASGQLSRQLSRSFSAFGSYTIQRQTTQGIVAASSNAFSGLSQTFGFGVTYSPGQIRLGRE